MKICGEVPSQTELDIFCNEEGSCLVELNYYSDFFEVDLLRTETTSKVVKKNSEFCARWELDSGNFQ